MLNQKTLISIVFITAAALLLAGTVLAAGPPGQEETNSPDDITLSGQAVAGKISYQGRLSDEETENPINGSANLVFQFWDDATAGNQQGSDIVKNDVAVSNGLFTVQLDVPQDIFNGRALWLRIQVNGQWLNSRQELLPAPYALGLKPGANIETGQVEARSIQTGRIKANSRDQEFQQAVLGVTHHPSSAGIEGANNYENGRGVYGWSTGPNGVGIFGRTFCNDLPDGPTFCVDERRQVKSPFSGTGVWGYAEEENSVGVYGTANGIGVYGQGRSFGGFFSSSDDNKDLALGGSIGSISTDPDDENSGLILSSNNYVTVRLDNDGGGSGRFEILNSRLRPLLSIAKDVVIGFDNNSGENGEFSIRNSGDIPVLSVTEKGEFSVGSSTYATSLYVAKDVGIRLDADDGRFEIFNSGDIPVLSVAENGEFSIRHTRTGASLLSVDEQGKTVARVLQITGGSDLSEKFEIRQTSANLQPVPGMVVSIDPDHPGELIVSAEAYDSKVAGIISGAGGIKPGMLMGQANSAADGEYPVALTGRVYVMADASTGPIQPGDLLTTSDRPGHAMKVVDYERARGAILGKAMTALDEEQGLVLVLVSLQ